MFWYSLVAVAQLCTAAAALTPKELLGAPRLGDIVPNPAGSRALYSSSSYSFDSHNKTNTWNVLSLEDDSTTEILSSVKPGEVVWLGTNPDSILYTLSGEKGETELWVANSSAKDPGYKAGSIAGPISDLKLASSEGNIRLVFSAKSDSDGSLYNPETAPKKYTTGLVYDSLFVRHWDKYVTPQTSAIFSTSLSLEGDQYVVASTKVANLLQGISGLESPVQPFGGKDSFDVSSDGKMVAFVSKAPELNPANHTASYVYLTAADGSSEPMLVNPPDGKDKDGKPLAKGASTSPVFSPDNKYLAYLQMYEDGYEADKNSIFIAEHIAITHVLEDWDRSPGSVQWLPGSDGLYLFAEDYGREKLFKASIDSSEPEELHGENSVSAASQLPDGKLLLSINSLTSSKVPHVFDPASKSLNKLSSVGHKTLSSQVEDFSFDGVDTKVHGFVIKPSNFEDRAAAWPLAFFIHGGPQGAWTDSWSTRWNPAVFAEAGYVVIAVNPTGSTGYGKKFTDAIQGEWGGKPYRDLELAIEHITSSAAYGYIDPERMVALGASYGGYMINYIQGMPLGRKFKALVCHDGVFTTLNQYTSEEIYFPQHDFMGTLWENRENYEKWDPARLLSNWATPQLVIHSDLDYRLPVGEGLAAFNVLQLRGIPSKFLTFPDENHWVLNPENSLLWHEEVMGWIDQWTSTDSLHNTVDQERHGQKKLQDPLQVVMGEL